MWTRELSTVLDEFCAAMATQDAQRLRAVFTEHDVSLVAANPIHVQEQTGLEHFIDGYCAQPTSYSFEWDRRQESVVGDVGWLMALGRETTHGPRGDHSHPFRMSLVCVRGADGWRIAQLHASQPTS